MHLLRCERSPSATWLYKELRLSHLSLRSDRLSLRANWPHGELLELVLTLLPWLHHLLTLILGRRRLTLLKSRIP